MFKKVIVYILLFALLLINLNCYVKPKYKDRYKFDNEYSFTALRNPKIEVKTKNKTKETGYFKEYRKGFVVLQDTASYNEGFENFIVLPLDDITSILPLDDTEIKHLKLIKDLTAFFPVRMAGCALGLYTGFMLDSEFEHKRDAFPLVGIAIAGITLTFLIYKLQLGASFKKMDNEEKVIFLRELGGLPKLTEPAVEGEYTIIPEKKPVDRKTTVMGLASVLIFFIAFGLYKK